MRKGTAGLMLFPNEVKLFRKGAIKPCLAIGKSPTHSRFKIITYQLTEDICPHLKNNSCTIYQERPLVCKGYPFTMSVDWKGMSFGVVPKCTSIKELMGRHQEIRVHDELKALINSIETGEQHFRRKEEIEARLLCMKKLQDYYILNHRKNKRWAYNLKTDKWKLNSRARSVGSSV